MTAKYQMKVFNKFKSKTLVGISNFALICLQI